MYMNSNDNMRTHVGASFDWSENDLAILIRRIVGVNALELAQLPPGLVPLCRDPFRPEILQALQVVGDGVGSSSAASSAAPIGGDVDYDDADDKVPIGLLGRQGLGKSKARGPDPEGKRSGFSPAPPPSSPHSGATTLASAAILATVSPSIAATPPAVTNTSGGNLPRLTDATGGHAGAGSDASPRGGSR
uniref:Uncharacterized protein n=1 Tax=Leersia perrieri TaxID=77586 RepID=A0A0D9WGQ9_9ORYZ